MLTDRPLAGKAAAAKQTRKPATKATKGRAPPAATRALSGEDHDVDDDDDDDELMMSERGEGDDDAAAAAADETTEVAETQFDSVKANARKGKAPATSSRRTAAAAAAAAAAQAGVQKKTVSAEDAIADELSGSILGPGKISAREKKLEAQLVLVGLPSQLSGVTSSRLLKVLTRAYSLPDAKSPGRL
jgi:hypothetical protein